MPDMEHTYDALETGVTISCPICGVDIPVPHTDSPDVDGLSVSFDREIADEHVQMHKNCTCRWEETSATGPVVRRITNLTCPMHGESR